MPQPDRRARPVNLLRCAGAMIALVVAGCTYTTTGTAPGTLNIQPPGTLPPAPRPVTAESATPQPPAPPPSGMFSGVARLTSRPAAGCRTRIDVTHFIVDGDRVRYMALRGTIRPDNSIRMQAGPSYVTGHFDGNRFSGIYWRPQPSCTYHIELTYDG